MLDSWVSPEAARFFISFTEGQSPLLPAPLPSLCCLSLLLVLFSLCHHPSLSLSHSYFFGALSPSLLLCAYKIKDRLFVSSLMSGNLHSLWSPHTEMGMLGLSPLFSALCFGENMFSSHHSPNISALPPPAFFYFIFVAKEKKKKRAGKESIWHMNNWNGSTLFLLLLFALSSSSPAPAIASPRDMGVVGKHVLIPLREVVRGGQCAAHTIPPELCPEDSG